MEPLEWDSHALSFPSCNSTHPSNEAICGQSIGSNLMYGLAVDQIDQFTSFNHCPAFWECIFTDLKESDGATRLVLA